MEKTLHSRVAAIDIGSNALRMQIFERSPQGVITAIETIRRPVRLGQDVFNSGKILPVSFNAALDAMREFSLLIDASKASQVGAVATSAVREASNGAAFVERVLRETGIEVQVIDSSEEARLIITALLERMNLTGLTVLHIEVGGGSVEVSLIEDTQIQFSLTHKLGAVRLMQLLHSCYDSQEKLTSILAEYTGITQKRLRHNLGTRKIDRFIATGGNIDSVVWLLGETGWAAVDKNNGCQRIASETLAMVMSELSRYSFNERVELLHLRPDRADVIVPAAQVYLSFAKMAKASWLYVPGVGVRDGLSIELFKKEDHAHQQQKFKQLISAVKSLGKKYEYDQTHAAIVTAYCLQIFDALKDYRGGLGQKERQLLEIAALLHDIGYFVGISRHHKHSYYLIAESDIVGLPPRDRLIVANIARYHRKSFPKEQHENFRILYPKERKIITKLASLLRIADALDREHGTEPMALTVELVANKLVIKLPPDKDRSFYRWTMSLKGDLFTETYGYQIEIN